MPLAPGNHLGPYEILSQLGAGGMGVVYKARDTRLGRDVALKILPSEKMADADRKRRFIQEARAASALNHPNIVTIYDIGESDGMDYIVMEYVDGRTLDHLIRRNGMKALATLKYTIPVADALARAHAAGIVHRDLKPSNVIVNQEDTVKVLDFGLAKLTGAASADDATRTIDQSHPGMIVGTAAYMSPEQAEARPADARSDLFSFGATLYEMLTGQKAFSGKTTVSTLAAVLHEEPKPARELAPQTPPELERIVRRCLRKEPDRRFQTAADLKVALQEVQEDIQAGRVEQPAAPPPAGRSRALRAAAIVAALVLGALGTWLALHRSAPIAREYSFRRLTDDSGITSNPALSRDGKLIAYQSDRAGTGITDIWLQQVAGGSAIRLTNCKANCMQPSFSPDGSSLVYFSQDVGGGIYRIPALGGEPRRLASPVLSYSGAAPKFSPDGTRIAYRVTGAPGQPSAIEIVDLAGSPSGKVRAEGVFPDSGFLWTPDSRGILALRRNGEEIRYWVFPLDGGTPKPAALGMTWRGSFRRIPYLESWTGNRIIMSASDAVHSSLLEIPVSGAGEPVGLARWITQGSGTEYDASESADGSRIAFSSYGSSNSGIWRIPLDVAAGKATGPPEQVTQPPRSYITPNPASRAPILAGVSRDGAMSVVWVRDLVSGRERRIAERAAWPLLSADGRKIVYQGFTRGRTDIGRGPLFLASTEGESARQVCDVCGQPYQFFAHDSKILFDHADPKSHEIRSLDLASGQTHLLLANPKNPIFAPHLSPDENWVSFTMVTGGSGRRFYVAPFRGAQQIPESDWTLVLQGESLERQPFWAPVGDLLYFLSDRDGFRCIWALRLDAKTRKAGGDPFAVQHFHDSRYSLMPFSNPGHIGLAVTTDAMFLSLYESRANVWLAEGKKSQP